MLGESDPNATALEHPTSQERSGPLPTRPYLHIHYILRPRHYIPGGRGGSRASFLHSSALYPPRNASQEGCESAPGAFDDWFARSSINNNFSHHLHEDGERVYSSVHHATMTTKHLNLCPLRCSLPLDLQ